MKNALKNVLKIIDNEFLAIWPTEVGYVTAKDGLLSRTAERSAIRDALKEAGAPVVHIPPRLEQLQHSAEVIFKDRILLPQSLYRHLRLKGNMVGLMSSQAKLEILEYFLSDPQFIDYSDLEIFPFEDGAYRSINNIAYVHRDDFEKALFCLDTSHNLDLEKLSRTAQKALRNCCESQPNHPYIRYRSTKCLRDYSTTTVFKDVPESEDMVVLGQRSTDFVSKVWAWLSLRGIDIIDEDVSCLWLLPLSNGRYRKVKPHRLLSSLIYVAPTDEVGQLMRSFDKKSHLKPLPLLLQELELSIPGCLSTLVKSPSSGSHLAIKDASDIIIFLQWLHGNAPLVEDATAEERNQIKSLIASNLPRPLTPEKRKVVVRSLSLLKLFQKLTWNEEGGNL